MNSEPNYLLRIAIVGAMISITMSSLVFGDNYVSKLHTLHETPTNGNYRTMAAIKDNTAQNCGDTAATGRSNVSSLATSDTKATCLIIHKDAIKADGTNRYIDLKGNGLQFPAFLHYYDGGTARKEFLASSDGEPFRKEGVVVGPAGTGFLVKDKKHVATAANVCDAFFANGNLNDNMRVVFGFYGEKSPGRVYLNTNQIYEIDRVVYDGRSDGTVELNNLYHPGTQIPQKIYKSDLVVLKLKTNVSYPNAAALTLDKYLKVNEGEELSHCSHPFSLSLKRMTPSSEVGVVLTKRSFDVDDDGYEIDAGCYATNIEAFPGSAGGPVVNANGELVGMVVRMWDGIGVSSQSPAFFCTTFEGCDDHSQGRYVHVIDNWELYEGYCLIP